MLFSDKDIKDSIPIIEHKEESSTYVDIVTSAQTKKKTLYSVTEKCDLSKYIYDFENDIEIISNGAFSMHQLARHIICLLNVPCNVYATTWAISEKIVSTLISLKQKGLINECCFLFDKKVMQYRPNAYSLFLHNFKCKIVSIHAKICVIETENISIRIVGSGNWTRNDKIEIYSISSNPILCEFNKNFIINEFERTE